LAYIFTVGGEEMSAASESGIGLFPDLVVDPHREVCGRTDY